MATRALQESLTAREDSAVDRVLWGEQSLPGVVSKSGRKQHRSCDQCRKGKKGCDAVILKDFGNDLADNSVEGSWGRSVLDFRSNCSGRVSDIVQERFPSVHARTAQKLARIVLSYGFSHKRETVFDERIMDRDHLQSA
jgi:hypothetical protein